MVDVDPSRRGLVLVLVGLTEGADPPAEVLTRARAAAAGARLAGTRVVHLGQGNGENGEVIVHPQIGKAASDTTVAVGPNGELSDAALDEVLGSGAGDVAIAGIPTGGLVAEVGRRAATRGRSVVLLDDASGDPEAEAHESALVTSGATVTDTETWLAGIRPTARSRRRVVSMLAVGVVVLLIIGVLAVAHEKAKGYYLLSPGSAPILTASDACRLRSSDSVDLTLADGKPCARLSVPDAHNHGISGSLFMVDVLEGQATSADYILNKLHLLKTFHQGSQLFPASSILGTTPAAQLPCENAQEMVQATTDAPVAALTRLGYDVHAQNLGAQIDLVMPNYPAAEAGLACNDVITSVNGHPIQTYEDVSKQLAGLTPGTEVTVGASSVGANGHATTKTVHVRLTSTPAEPGVEPAQPNKGFLGVELETKTTYKLPFNLSIDVGDIGGPSAGLALTLGLMDVLSDGELTGGHKVAATGTITPDGTVGPIGGLDQKAVAVRKAGAQVFFVPDPVDASDVADLKTARSEVGKKLKIYPVASLSQALTILTSLGGKVPAPSGG